MLSQLIHLLEANEGEVGLTAISRALNAEPSAVSGMLETLVRKGRVIEVTPECGVCDTYASNDNTPCELDCAGTWGGTASADDCGVCDTDSSNDNTNRTSSVSAG